MKLRSYNMDVVVGLILFCVFTGALLMVLATGAGAYRNISSNMEKQYGERTCLGYIAAKVQHFDTEGGVTLTDFMGIPALELAENIDGDQYTNLIYYMSGSLWELYCLKDSGLKPEDGFPVLSASGVTFEQISPSLLRVGCLENGSYSEILIGMQSGRTVEG